MDFEAFHLFLPRKAAPASAHQTDRVPALSARLDDFFEPHVPGINGMPNKADFHLDFRSSVFPTAAVHRASPAPHAARTRAFDCMQPTASSTTSPVFVTCLP